MNVDDLFLLAVFIFLFNGTLLLAYGLYRFVAWVFDLPEDF